MKKLVAVVLAVVLLATMIGTASAALANPKGMRDPDIGHMLYKFNIIAVPNEWVADDTVCPNSGHRIFVKRDWDGGQNRLATITWDPEPGYTQFRIADCDATTDKTARIESPMFVNVVVGLRVHGKGKPGLEDELNIKCINPLPELEQNMICLIDDANIKKSNRFTKIMAGYFGDALEDVTWELWTVNGKKFRVAEVRVYEKL